MPESSAIAGDEELVARVAGGDERAFAALHARHDAYLQSLARRVLAHAHADPEGAVQEAWLRVHRAPTSGARPGAMRPWVARNVCLEELAGEPFSGAVELRAGYDLGGALIALEAHG